MKEFMLLFRHPEQDLNSLSDAEMQALGKKWQDWAGGIASQGRMAGSGPRLDGSGKVLKAGGVITDGPFAEGRQRLDNYLIVKAESLDDAVTLAHGCPALDMGGCVEVRPIYA